MPNPIRVLIVDDHAMVRIGLSEAVRSQRDMEVVAEACDGEEALRCYERTQPDIVLMDYQMPRMDGVEATSKLRESSADAKVILLSILGGEEDVWRAVKAGVSGYLPKSAPMKEIIAAIRQVHSGDTYYAAEIASKLDHRGKRLDMTAREMDVLKLIVGGSCNKEIADALEVSEGNVRLYVSRVLAKLGVADRTQAAVKAIKSGLIHLGG